MSLFDDLQERFGVDALGELGVIDMRSGELIDRLFKLTAIAVNLQQLGIGGGEKWFNNQSKHIGILMDETEKAVEEFQKLHGEI